MDPARAPAVSYLERILWFCRGSSGPMIRVQSGPLCPKPMGRVVSLGTDVDTSGSEHLRSGGR